MIQKQAIVAALGEVGLALPRLIEDGLLANDRAKYRLTLLQLGRHHAAAPELAVASLQAERLAARLADPTLDRLPEACVATGDLLQWPGSAAVVRAVADDVRTMLAAALAGGGELKAAEIAALEARAATLLAPLDAASDRFAAEQLDDWTRPDRARGDSVHLLIMDLHRALNRLQRAIATEIIDGASTYSIGPDDRARIVAFMRGLARTSPLRFDHPGLGTTATRSGERLLIQNDIGTTDAHVLVVHVEAQTVAVTYTDVHLQRLLFFQALFGSRGVVWQDARLVQDRRMEDGLYHVTVGRHQGAGEHDVCEFLEFLGSRLVFLIDWNRARKQLRLLTSKKQAIRLLQWAAERDLGHMAFLRVGGAQAVFDALDFAARGHGRFGQTLQDVLGSERAECLLQFVLETSARELLAGRSESLVVDRLRAELSHQLRSSAVDALDLAVEHASLVVELAGAVRDALAALDRTGAPTTVRALAARAKCWETDADHLLNRLRDTARGAPETQHLRQFVERADDVADDLEEAAFLGTLLLSTPVPDRVRTGLVQLAGQLVAGTREMVKALETLRMVGPRATGDDVEDFLRAVHRIGRVEHETDALKRAMTTELLATNCDARQTYLATESAAKLERAADHLLHAAFGLRDAVLERASGR